jgi:hypothetical protein
MLTAKFIEREAGELAGDEKRQGVLNDTDRE